MGLMLMANDSFRLLASMSDVGYVDNLSYKERMTEAYQNKINSKFDQATSFITIQEESPYGSGEYTDFSCRINSVRTVGTGTKMSDSYKSIIFKDSSHEKGVGYLYKFENNYWITCNSDEIIVTDVTNTVVIRRCNNILRWKDAYGVIQTTPISFEEEGFSLTNSISQEIDRGSGHRKAIIQRNDITMGIQPNQRFIFGKQCLKLSGAGIESFLNQETENDSSNAIIRLTFEYDSINPSIDDLTNQIANAYSNTYSLKINQKNTTYSLSNETYTFNATMLQNNVLAKQDLIWNVSSNSSYSITQSNNEAKIKFEGTGSYVINVYSKNNADIKDSLTVNVISADKYTIQCSPTPSVLYRGDTGVYKFSLYKNGVIITDAVFNFVKNDILSELYYTYTINGSELSMTNKKTTTTKASITCTSSNYPTAEQYVFNVELGGAW